MFFFKTIIEELTLYEYWYRNIGIDTLIFNSVLNENIKDYEYNINHMNDVVSYTKELLNNINLEITIDVCIISAYWHDVGRIKINEGHEKLSAEMLKEE